MAFTVTSIVSEFEILEENLSNGELSENANLQEASNKLCKIAAKDTCRYCNLYLLRLGPCSLMMLKL